MPTIHLSVPERMYRELKREAEKLGIQVTDLVKMFIKQGLDQIRRNELREEEQYNTTKLDQILKLIEQLRNDMEARFAYLEGRIYQLNEVVKHVTRRIEELESGVSEGEEIMEPEIIPPGTIKQKALGYEH